jgi:multidrug efflux pump subunit AcrA (membrane-fusion protein)
MNQWARVAALLGSLGVGLGLLTGCGPGSKDPANTTPQDVAQVGVVVLQPQDQALQTTLPGRVRAFQMAEVRPQVGGIIQKQLFTEGAGAVPDRCHLAAGQPQQRPSGAGQGAGQL